jgi:PKHD-type hydroxylase
MSEPAGRSVAAHLFPVPSRTGVTTVSIRSGAFTASECAEVTAMHLAEAAAGQASERLELGWRDVLVTPLSPRPDRAWLWERMEDHARAANAECFGYDLWGIYEPPTVLCYPVGGRVNWHNDLGPGVPGSRKLAMIVQLSRPDEHEGGGLRLHPGHGDGVPLPIAQGDLVVFPAWCLHAVDPVTDGQRRSLVTWIAGPAFR